MHKSETQNGRPPAVTADVPVRPVLRQKTCYVPHSPPEEFIVPLLRREIETCIEHYATPPRGTAKAVDLGCGAQPFRASLEQMGYSYCGVDANPGEGPTMDFVCAVDGSLPQELLRRGPFDFLLCTEVLEHVADWHAAFANFGMLLAPGGRALITAPQFYQLHEEPYDFWRPTLHAIDYYASRAGLQPLYRHPAGDAWDVLGTTLANCRFVASSSRLRDRALAKAIRLASRLAFRVLLRRKLQARVRVEGPLYLSNVVVLEKRGAVKS
jgi:SAM-dependent methyltransferase